MSKKLKMMIALTVLMMVGFISTSLLSYFTARNSLFDQVSNSALPLTSDNIYSKIQQDLLLPIFISSVMAQDTFVRDWTIAGEKDPDKIVRYLNEIQHKYHTVTSFYVSERTRNYYHPSGIIKQVSKKESQDAWYFRNRTMKAEYEINIDRDSADMSSMTVFINHRVFDYSGNFIGVIGIGLGVKTVQTLIEQYQQCFARIIFFTDRTGKITLASKNYHGPNRLDKMEHLANHKEQILNSANTSLVIKEQTHSTFYNTRFVPEFNWYLVVSQTSAPGEQIIRKTLLGNLLISFIIMVAILFLANLTIGAYQRDLEAMATTDKLTGIANRQVFDLMFLKMHKLAQRNNVPLTVLICDIDHFKQVNDTYGHPVGDKVLCAVATLLQQEIRESDLLLRWGGEEFLLLMSNCSRLKAYDMAEQLRSKIASLIVNHDQQAIQVTISFGLTQVLPTEKSDEIIVRADKALYCAKRNGRNRVECN